MDRNVRVAQVQGVLERRFFFKEDILKSVILELFSNYMIIFLYFSGTSQ